MRLKAAVADSGISAKATACDAWASMCGTVDSTVSASVSWMFAICSSTWASASAAEREVRGRLSSRST